jgi:thiamine biosynthesis lipoprotein
MGTAVTVEIRDPVVPAPALERAFAQLRWVDRMFSTYDEHSQISRINAGVLDVRDAHPLVREVLTHCDALKTATHGYFDVRAPLPGAVDPSGLVKGWAVDLAFAWPRWWCWAAVPWRPREPTNGENTSSIPIPAGRPRAR